jgi:Uma2 family endonuclease
MTLTIKDVERLQAQLEDEPNDYQIELHDGEIIVMGPSDIVSSEVGVMLIQILSSWVYPRRLGRVFDSSGGFILPNSDLAAPDVSYVSRQRMKQPVRDFGQLVPDLVVEIKSQSDRLGKLRKKLRMFLEQGAKVGILIDPDELTVTVYRPSQKPLKLQNEEILSVPELFPGWEVSIAQLWPPVYEDDE